MADLKIVLEFSEKDVSALRSSILELYPNKTPIEVLDGIEMGVSDDKWVDSILGSILQKLVQKDLVQKGLRAKAIRLATEAALAVEFSEPIKVSFPDGTVIES